MLPLTLWKPYLKYTLWLSQPLDHLVKTLFQVINLIIGLLGISSLSETVSDVTNVLNSNDEIWFPLDLYYKYETLV